jgi:2-oxoglutarate dehydrogenase E1 component
MSSYIGHSSFLNGANATFVAELYSKYLERPDSVDSDWAEFFSTLHDDARETLEDLNGASWAPRDGRVIGGGANGANGNGHAASAPTVPAGAPLEPRPTLPHLLIRYAGRPSILSGP